MDVLVVSDSHGFVNNLYRILDREHRCKTVFFLGDGLRDIEECQEFYPDRKFVAVRGNNDFSAAYDDEAYQFIEGNTIVAVHGHTLDVRMTRSGLFKKAESVMANAAFYGHTHIQRYEDRNGICLLNPGAVCDGKYAVVSLTEKGVEPRLKSLFG